MAENDQAQTAESLDLLLKELAQRIERLKHLYEQYFMGLERMEPTVARKEITRAMMALQQNYIRNTALRFRFNTMLQKWSLYTQHWNKILREIENGTYVKHLQRAARHAEQKGRSLPSEMRVRGASTVAPADGAEHEFDDSPPTQKGAVTDEIDLAAVADDGDDLDSLIEAALGPSAKSTPAPKPAPPPSPSKPPPLPGAKGVVPPPMQPMPYTPTPPGGVTIRVTPPFGTALPSETPPQGVPTRATPPQGVPTRATPPQGVPTRATPPQGVPTRATPPQGVPARTAATSLPGVSEAELRALHRTYSEAKAKAGDAAPVRYETLVASLAKQVPKMMQQPGVRGVRFTVEVKDGKPVVKAIPTK